jgi:capsule polysaccharide export protein KpsE/RkpR
MTNQLDLTFLLRRPARNRIAAVTAAFAAIGLIYGALAPKWYRSVLTVVPTKSQHGGGGLSSLLGGEAASLAAGFLDGAGANADAARIAAVLQSIAVSDAVIEKFGLRERYDAPYQETARDALWQHCDVKVLLKPQLVQLSCEDRDPRFVQQLLAYFAEYGNKAFRGVSVSSSSEEVAFLEKRVAELRQQAEDTAKRMREFQEQHKIVDIDTQAKAVVSALAMLNSQRISKQLELDYQRTYSSSDEPSLRQLETQVAVMGQRERSLEGPPAPDPQLAVKGAQGAARGKSGMFPAALEVPRLREEFESLYRDRKVAEATLVFALERLEGARATAARDVSTFQVLDPPAVPTRKSRPRRAVILALFVMLGLLASVGFELLPQTGVIAVLKSAAASPGPPRPPAVVNDPERRASNTSK